MGTVALLLAVVVGASAAPVMSVFGFMAALTTVFLLGSVAAAAGSDSVGRTLWTVLALFVLAQVGYVLGLAVLAKFRGHRDTARGGTPSSTPCRHFRVRK